MDTNGISTRWLILGNGLMDDGLSWSCDNQLGKQVSVMLNIMMTSDQ